MHENASAFLTFSPQHYLGGEYPVLVGEGAGAAAFFGEAADGLDSHAAAPALGGLEHPLLFPYLSPKGVGHLD